MFLIIHKSTDSWRLLSHHTNLGKSTVPNSKQGPLRRWAGGLVQKRGHLQDDARLAIAALHYLILDPGLLDRMLLGYALDGGDLPALFLSVPYLGPETRRIQCQANRSLLLQHCMLNRLPGFEGGTSLARPTFWQPAESRICDKWSALAG